MGQSRGGLRGHTSDDDGANDVKRQVDSDDNFQKPIYQLVNVKNGGGKLIDIIKSSVRYSSSSFALDTRTIEITNAQKQIEDNVSYSEKKKVNRQIYELVEPLLYNKGNGKLIPLSRIWMYRLGKAKELTEDEEEFHEAIKNPSECRWVCWKLNERGFVGETALHICFLLSTPTHMILARRLLTLFPKLIDDIYTCDEYFGESSLHMAIVNENVRIVKLLVDHGSDVHERCLGSFFLPTDQKDKANGQVKRLLDKIKSGTKHQIDTEADYVDLKSNHFNSLKTDYDGYVYWGEYPLSFAACLGLTDCYQLLLAKGADPNRQDSNGNSTLHMTVIADRIDMFDLCYSSGADLSILNKQNMNPLTLAAKLKRVKMLFHILTILRQVNWIFCNVGFIEAPLASVDSVNVLDGSYNDDSILSIVVFGGSNEHLQMLDGLLSQLLEVKWDSWARKKFYWWMLQFLVCFTLSIIAYVTRFTLKKKSNLDNSGYLFFEITRTASESLLVCYMIHYLWVAIRRIVPSLGLVGLFKTLAQAPEVSLFMVTCLLVLICIPLRLLEWNRTEDFLAAIIMFTLPLKLLFFCRASKSVGPFVVMIYKILVNDVLCFVVFLVIFVAGFSQSFLIIFRTHQPSTQNNTIGTISDNNYFTNLFDGIISMHMMALNEFTVVVDEFSSTYYPGLAKVLFLAYMIIVSILLMNMLIAMLGKTYQDVASQPNENLRQWARALLIVERFCTSRERLSMLDKYSHKKTKSSGGCRFYGSTWALNPKDHEEIETLNKLNVENKKNLIRLIRMRANNLHPMN